MLKEKFSFKFTELEKQFWSAEINYNRRFFMVVLFLMAGIEFILLVSYYFAYTNSILPDINDNYYLLYLVGLVLSIVFALVIYNMKTQSRFVQIFCLSCLMLWACVFSIVDIKNGFHSYVLAHVLILSAASIHFPGRIHFSINILTYLLYIILLIPLGLNPSSFLSDIINTGILFFFSSFIILFINESRFLNFKNSLIMEKQQKQLLHMTQYDGLTGLYSRTTILNYLEESIANNQSVGCIMSDIDNFKRYNDKYGHRTGDEVLRQSALTLNKVVQEYQGRAGRYGGEEFFVVLTDCDDAKLREVLEELQKAFQDPADNHTITLSMGGTLQHNEETTDTLISRADKAMYRAKNAGKHTFRIL